MADAKHTPGPWRAAIRANQYGPQMVAVDMPPCGAWKPTRGRLTPEDVANAHMMAASPEMFEIHQASIGLLEIVLKEREAVNGAEVELLRDLIRRKREVVAKAGGQS